MTSVKPIQRVGEYLLTLLVAVSINFFLPRALPGDPLALIAGDAVRQMGPERIAELRAAYGLDRPLIVQYFGYLGDLLRGDLGTSFRYSGGRPVTQVLADRFVWTMFLVISALVIATLIGAAMGARAGWKRRGGLGTLTAMFTLRSMPVFWLAMIIIPVFAVSLGWFPSGDSYSIPRPAGWAGVLDVIRHAVLPVSVLAISYVPIAYAMMRASVINVTNEPHLLLARAKGLKDHTMLYRHGVRNAAAPVVTMLALDFGQLLGGVILIETVFNYRGIGSMMFEAAKTRDYPLLQGGFLLFTLGVLALNLFTEWLYPRLDPRLRSPR
jgi:peptide/nickel transport system permease protein